MAIGFAVLADKSCRPLESLGEVAEVWSHPESHIWVDLESPTEDDLRRLGEIMDLDNASLEDCLYGEQRPRVDEHDHYIFLVIYGLYGLKKEDVKPHKLSGFCGRRFVITVHRRPLLSIRQVRARCGRHPETLLVQGVDMVLFSIIDTMIDNYLQVTDRYEDRLEDLEERSFRQDQDEDLLEQAADVRRDLLELRRLAVAQRQLLQPLAKGQYDFISGTLSKRFSHVYDHLSQVIEAVDGLRETVISIRENYRAALTQRTNEIVKVLTLYAAIIMPLTLIAGIYGMNLPLWPPPDDPLSFWGVLTAMGLMTVVLAVFFRRRKWL